MELDLSYIHNGKKGIAKPNAADFIKWEKVTGQKLVDIMTENSLRLGVTDLGVLCWSWCTKNLVTNEPFETWQLGLEDIALEDVIDPKDTNPEVSITLDASTLPEASLTVDGKNSTGTTSTQ